jgi:hypothetical protein
VYADTEIVCLSMKTYWGNGDIAPRILNLVIKWRGVVGFTPRPFYPPG